MNKSQWIDLTLPLGEKITRLKAQTETGSKIPDGRVYRIFDAEKGDKVTMSRIEMGSHESTHIDAPRHFIKGGGTIDEMPLDTGIGPARVIEIKNQQEINVAELEPYNIQAGERILFKTANSPKVWSTYQWDGDWVGLTVEAAEYLVNRKIRLMGLDFMTVGKKEPRETIEKVHLAFLSHGIYIIEGLNMTGVKPGNYEMVCLPLPVKGGDAAPCRICIRPV